MTSPENGKETTRRSGQPITYQGLLLARAAVGLHTVKALWCKVVVPRTARKKHRVCSKT